MDKEKKRVFIVSFWLKKKSSALRGFVLDEGAMTPSCLVVFVSKEEEA